MDIAYRWIFSFDHRLYPAMDLVPEIVRMIDTRFEVKKISSSEYLSSFYLETKTYPIRYFLQLPHYLFNMH